MNIKKRVHVIACGVLSLDIEKIRNELGFDISVEFLPGGLHETPHKLRERLQEAIDAASKNDIADMIALGYGICGKGTVGLKARDIPLAIPKVHDCIALFLGSDKEYRKQFASCPGTYYVSAGWVNEKVTPQELCKTCLVSPDERVDFSHLVNTYGKENAEHIKHFFTSWQRNYERAAFIDTGVESKNDRYERVATMMAEDFQWRYERLEGTHHILKALLKTRSTTDEILVVPPKHMTVWDALNNGLGVSPVWSTVEDAEKTAVFLDKAGCEVEQGRYLEAIDGKFCGAKLGIGIDAGGTYTDVVLYDFETECVLSKAKAPTTKWDFTIGINEAIGKLEIENPQNIDLVTLSTTLATNSIVEGKGQKVGLLIMPPYGIYHDGDIEYDTLEVISGKLDINGKELEPVDPEQVRRIARSMIESKGVDAFAVTGFASINNHVHEIEVKEILKKEFGCSVTCGHEISADLNYRIRSITSALNASIIPCLEKLLNEMIDSLEKQGISAQQMVVRSDGSLMNIRTALERPIETILSGPASSAKGAGFLAKVDEGLVIDIGGTTTDTAIIKRGQVMINLDGASVGGYRTHVKTLDLRTFGLGGDSIIYSEKSEIGIGPQRVMPISRMALEYPDVVKCIEWAGENKDRYLSSSRGMEILVLTDNCAAAKDNWSEKERKILTLLQERPMTLDQLAVAVDTFSSKYLPVARLEGSFAVQRTGLTPTDLLHVIGKVDFADSGAAEALCKVYADIFGMSVTAFAEEALLEVRKMLTLEMIKRELAGEVDVEGIEESPLASVLLENLYTEGNLDYRVGFELKHPVIGIGAPTEELLIPSNKWLNTECIIPPHAEVANAVGAIISPVHIVKEVRIEPGSDGEYIVQGLLGSPRYSEFEEAHKKVLEALHEIILESATASGTDAELVKIAWQDKISDLYDDGAIFVARVYTGEITGMPRMQHVE